MQFEIIINSKKLVFNSDLHGLVADGKEYISGKDGVLVYDQVKEIHTGNVELQMSTNTSTLIPALKVLGLKYNSYFDLRNVLESQNDITFYWSKSKLAAFYNRYSTDTLDFSERLPVIKGAVKFLINSVTSFDLKDEFLAKSIEESKLLGFYQGFPIFDSNFGFAKLQSRLGIHIDPEEIMISTPLNKYEKDVYELAEQISESTKLDYSKKKNRVIFQKNKKIFKLFQL